MVRIVVGALALVMPELLMALDAPSAVVLAAVVIAAAAAVTLCRLVATLATGAPRPPSPAVAAATSYLAGRVTDPVHHPLRPRAPGLV